MKKSISKLHALVDELSSSVSEDVMDAMLTLFSALVAQEGEELELEGEGDEDEDEKPAKKKTKKSEEEEEDLDGDEEDTSEDDDNLDDNLDDEKPAKKTKKTPAKKSKTTAKKKVVDEDEDEDAEDTAGEVELPTLDSAKKFDSFLDELSDVEPDDVPEDMVEPFAEMGIRELSAEIKAFGLDPDEMVKIKEKGSAGRKAKAVAYGVILAKFTYCQEQLMELSEADRNRLSKKYGVTAVSGSKAKLKKWAISVIAAVYGEEEEE